MSNKFEKLLDYLVNEEHEKANELFHEIVVEKSRSIYENLIAQEGQEDDEEEMDESREEDDEEMDESMMDDESMMNDESMMDDESMFEIGGDPADHMVGDVEDDSMDDMGGMEDDGMDDMGEFGDDDSLGTELGDEGTEQNLLDKLDQLEAKLDAIIAGEKHEEEENPDIHGHEMDSLTHTGEEDFDDEGEEDFDDEDEEDFDDEEEEDEEEEDMEENLVREYKEIVRKGKDYAAGSPGEEGFVHKKSPTNFNPKDRPTTGAKAHNIATGKGKEHDEDGAKPHGKSGGLVGNVKGKFTDVVDQNIDGKETKGYSHSVKKPKKGENGGTNKHDILPNR